MRKPNQQTSRIVIKTGQEWIDHLERELAEADAREHAYEAAGEHDKADDMVDRYNHLADLLETIDDLTAEYEPMTMGVGQVSPELEAIIRARFGDRIPPSQQIRFASPAEQAKLMPSQASRLATYWALVDNRRFVEATTLPLRKLTPEQAQLIQHPGRRSAQ